MPKLNISVTHNLPQDEALGRIKNLLAELKREFANDIRNLRERWRGNAGNFRFSTRGFSASGTLTIRRETVELSLNIPLAALPLKGKIESTIRRRARSLLADP